MAQEQALQRDRNRVVAQAKLIGRITEFVEQFELPMTTPSCCGSYKTFEPGWPRLRKDYLTK